MDIFFLLLFGHALGDYAFQSQHMVEHKHKKNDAEHWYIFLAAHSIIHGGLVGFFTGSFVLALLETACHAVIDYLKCEGKINLKLDQILHIGCKGLWIILLVKGVV